MERKCAEDIEMSLQIHFEGRRRFKQREHLTGRHPQRPQGGGMADHAVGHDTKARQVGVQSFQKKRGKGAVDIGKKGLLP